MVEPTVIMGIDPGLVHTGVVVLELTTDLTSLGHVVDGIDHQEIVRLVREHKPDHVFVEAYRPRSNFQQDPKMGEGINILKTMLSCKTILNTGVKQVITKELMQLLKVWTFDLKSNHQDLRSAARIALYGMVKDEELNRLLTTVVINRLDNKE